MEVEGGIFQFDLVQGSGDLGLVAAALRGDRQADHGRGEVDVRQEQVAQRHARLEVFHLRHGNDLAGAGRVDGLGLVGLDLEQLAQLHALANALGMHGLVALQRARVDADEAQLLHEGVDAGLEDLRHQRPVGIGHDVNHLLVGGDGGAMDRIGRQAAEDQRVQ